MLKIAIQKSGKLFESSVKLLKDSGVVFNTNKDNLRVKAVNFPLEILFLRDDDIPICVSDGVADLGIVGLNLLEEQKSKLPVVFSFGFGKCRLSLAAYANAGINNIKDINGRKIATSYPNTLQNFLKSNDIQAEIHFISGSVELAPSIGLADLIFDIVSSGTTLKNNNLTELFTVSKSTAVLIKNPKLDDTNTLFQELIFRFNSIENANQKKYVLLNCPNSSIEQICNILPGIKSPTIMPLAQDGWSSLHSVIHEQDFWEILGRLKSLGAEGILILPIEKLIN